MMADLVNGCIVDTRYGKLYVLPTEANHVYATTNPDGGKQDSILPWTIRGKEHRYITLHLYRRDGTFHVGGSEHDRAGFYCESASASAKQVIIEEAERVVNALPARMFDKAEVLALTEKIERLKAKREEASALAQSLTDQIGETIEKLNAVVGTGFKKGPK